ncbi:MAG: alanine racemase [Bdellovibrionaceae bacterium]|nr:alanine racemase [Pseudobdellovibrionaceae bacterium]
MFRKTFAQIDLSALRKNLKLIRSHFGQERFLCPMVKANAYGHGDVRIAQELWAQGVSVLGVCLIEEGVLLRAFGLKSQILIFRGFDAHGAREIIAQGLTPVVSSWEHLDHLEAEVKSDPVSVHIKFDTGMNRLGFSLSEAERLIERLKRSPKIRVSAVLTHLAQGEDGFQTEGMTARQLRSFFPVAQRFRQEFQAIVHALNSGAIVSAMSSSALPEHLTLMDWGLRPGLMLYGYNPVRGVEIPLEPVMTLKSHVQVLRWLRPGEGVSYGATWKAKVDSLIGVVPIGYADGYHRILSNKSEVLVCGERVPVIGAICMDYLMIDLTRLKNERHLQGAEVVLFGKQGNQHISADELAQKAQTITWEILTSVGERVPRIYAEGVA